jgi:crotonobetainyl-CoA:carnitine CoA-transferase CaiB-like acyl-CoA transferase
MTSAALPLEGYRVIDVTANMSGPFGTQVLGDQGADVIKVEPLGGDVIRGVGTSRNGMSTYFANLNRSKRSLAVDVSTAAGRDLVLRLCDGADVFVENYRAGALAGVGLGPDDVRGRSGRIVYASITGFGHEGPYADRPAYDHVIQALSGNAARQAGRDGEPDLIRHGAIDKVSGLWLAQAVTAALLRRERTGQGAFVEVCMLEAAVAWLWPDGMMNRTCLEPDVRGLPDVATSFRLTRTADGHVAVALLTTEQWRGVVVLTGRDDLLEDAEFATVAGRTRLGGPVLREFGRRVAAMPTAEVVAALHELGVPCAPVVALDDLADHPQLRESDIVWEATHPQLGRMRMPKPVPSWDGVDEGGRRSLRLPPATGEHTDEVLRDLGCSADEIAGLRARRVVA